MATTRTLLGGKSSQTPRQNIWASPTGRGGSFRSKDNLGVTRKRLRLETLERSRGFVGVSSVVSGRRWFLASVSNRRRWAFLRVLNPTPRNTRRSYPHRARAPSRRTLLPGSITYVFLHQGGSVTKNKRYGTKAGGRTTHVEEGSTLTQITLTLNPPPPPALPAKVTPCEVLTRVFSAKLVAYLAPFPQQTTKRCK